MVLELSAFPTMDLLSNFFLHIPNHFCRRSIRKFFGERLALRQQKRFDAA
jgi:hypothetical protein